MNLILGHDFGQSSDPSALCAVERVALETPVLRRKYRYVVRYLESYPLGMSYPDQVKRTCETLSHPAFKRAKCGVDYTGVGRPVYDMLKVARPPVLLYPVLTTGGTASTFDRTTRELHVPKVDLVGNLQLLVYAKLVAWHEKLPLAAAFIEQLARFERKQKRETGYNSYNAAAGAHDDLVSALMIACYLGEHHGGPADPAGIGLPADDRGTGCAGSVVADAPPGVFHDRPGAGR
jgi:hypothetical protein